MNEAVVGDARARQGQANQIGLVRICPVNSILARVVIWGVESSIATGASHGTRSGVGTGLAEADAGV